jgi:hypothetical protein
VCLIGGVFVHKIDFFLWCVRMPRRSSRSEVSDGKLEKNEKFDFFEKCGFVESVNERNRRVCSKQENTKLFIENKF